MDFFNKIGKKASETYQVTKEKTVKFSEEMKLKGKINEEKNKIADCYEEIGKHIYNQYKTNSEEGKEEIETKCKEIEKSFEEIEKTEVAILALKESKKCNSCGVEINKSDDFCPKCGKEQPKQEEKVEVVTEEPEVKEAEIVEINDAEKNNTENNE